MSVELFNATAYLVDRQVGAGNGGKAAICGPAGSLSYEQLAGAVREFAAGLRSIGVRPEERIVLVMPDRPETFVTILAAMWLGAVAVPVSTMYNAAELGTLVRDARARVVVMTPEFEKVVREAVAEPGDVQVLICAGGPPAQPGDGDVLTWEGVRAAGRAAAMADPYATWPDSPALWLYTSGTTGLPKAAMHRHGSIRDVCETYGSQVLGITPADRCFSVARLFFAYGIGNSMFFPLSVGATAILDPARATPAGVVERLLAERPTLLFAGPSFFAALLAADAPAGAFSSVRLAVSAGEALPAGIYQRFTTRYGVDIIDGLGSTEALHIFISNQPGQVLPGSTGTVVPGYEARILDDAGAPVEDGQPGNLYVRGGSIATGYWCRAAATRQVFQGEWLRTGDVYVRSGDGFFHCLGRSNDMIKAGGIWVSPREVEERLTAHDSVAECAVVAYTDHEGLEKPVACVVAAPGHSVETGELMRFCREGLASFKRPREVLVLGELPKTATGKIRRSAVREIVADRLGR